MKDQYTIIQIKEKLTELIEKAKDRDYKLSTPKQAEEMGIPYKTFLKYVNGESEPSASNLKRIAIYYGVSSDYLLDLIDGPSHAEGITQIQEWLGVSRIAGDGLLRRFHPGNNREYYLEAFNALFEDPFSGELLRLFGECIYFGGTLTDYEKELIKRKQHPLQNPDRIGGDNVQIDREIRKKALLYAIQTKTAKFAEMLIEKSEQINAAPSVDDTEDGESQNETSTL